MTIGNTRVQGMEVHASDREIVEAAVTQDGKLRALTIVDVAQLVGVCFSWSQPYQTRRMGSNADMCLRVIPATHTPSLR